jgi:lysozyme family protein
MLMSKDNRYQYGNQLTKWCQDLDSIRHVLEPYKRDYPHCIVRKDKSGRVAVFSKKPCTMRQRYELEVKRGCVVVPLER